MGVKFSKYLVIDFGIQWIGFILASVLRTERFFDITGSFTFCLLAYLSYKWNKKLSTRQKIQLCMITTWALRLGLFLLSRIMLKGGDRRFRNIKQSPWMFFITWNLQALWVIISLMPSLILTSKDDQQVVSTRDYIGRALWVAGMALEIVADYQKFTFGNNADNAGKFISSGLWRFSRHPNYFGEILLWTGLYVSASTCFQKYEHLSILSPVFTALLLTKISGVPMLERYGLKKWGHLDEYQSYLKNTPMIIPKFW